MKICPKCQINHLKSGTFCSRKCANSRVFTNDSNLRRGASVKAAAAKMNKVLFSEAVKRGSKYQGPYCKLTPRKCSACGVDYLASRDKPQYTTCSEECFLFIKRKNRAGNKTAYKDEMYDSSWEADLAKWFDENNIQYTRPKQSIKWIDSKGKERKYFPDFYIPVLELYVDPKNKFCIKDQQEKLDKVSVSIQLIYGEVSILKETISRQITMRG
jgi:hypothetical protein